MTKKSLLVVFRVDASVDIGTGHVVRCLTLADELTRKGHQCRFICREHKGHLGRVIVSKGYEVALLPGSGGMEQESVDRMENPHAAWLGVPWQQDAEQTVEAVSRAKTDWLVVDHYILDARWEKKVATAVGRIMVIDDLADRKHECALLLDQNLGRVASDYDQLVPSDCVQMIGSRFALLRPEFARFRECSLQRRKDPELKRILISLGGVDQENITCQVLNALTETSLPPDTELDILMGSSAPFLVDVQQLARHLPFRATVSVNVSDMGERMYLSDLSIGAAGSTSWERCCVGLPSIIMVLADNQRSAAHALSEQGIAIVVDSAEMVRDEVNRLLTAGNLPESLVAMSKAGGKTVDGGGCARVSQELTDITKQ